MAFPLCPCSLQQAPLIYRDAFLESMKNTLLVVLTCPFVAAGVIPSDLMERLSPASVVPLVVPPKQQEGQQQPADTAGLGEPHGAEDAGLNATRHEGLLAALSCLTDSQRLVVSAVSPFVGSSFPGVVKELLLILPTPQPPPRPPQHERVADAEPEAKNHADGTPGISDGDGAGYAPASDTNDNPGHAVESTAEPNAVVTAAGVGGAAAP